MNGEEVDLWLLAGELASPNFYWQGAYYAKSRYALQRLDGRESVTLIPGTPHGQPQADSIAADDADRIQRRTYGHLSQLLAEAKRQRRD